MRETNKLIAKVECVTLNGISIQTLILVSWEAPLAKLYNFDIPCTKCRILYSKPRLEKHVGRDWISHRTSGIMVNDFGRKFYILTCIL